MRVLLQHSDMRQKEIAQKFNVSPQSASSIKKKLDRGLSLQNGRTGKCGKKRKTTPRSDRKIKNIALKDRRTTCKRTSSNLAEEGIIRSRRTVNRRLLECGLKAYHPRKKTRLTPKMVNARLDWAKQHKHWTEYDWSNVIVYLFTCLNYSNFSASSC